MPLRGLTRPALPAAVLLAGVGFFLLWAWVVAQRITYPHALEVMEEGMAGHALRVMGGEPLYTEPSLSWTPLIYGPVYHYVAAGLFWLLGPRLLWLRAISVVATLVSLLLLARVAAARAGRWAGVASASLFVATYFASGAWFDLGRIDMLHLAFMLASVRALQRERTGIAVVWALLAVFTKQSALGPLLGAALGLAFVARRRAVLYGGGLLLGTAAITALGSALTDGWFAYYLFELPSRHRMLWQLTHEVFVTRLLWELGPMVVLGLVAIGLELTSSRWRSGMLLLGFAGASVVVSCLARLRDGGWYNVMIPAHAGLALLAGIAIGELRQWDAGEVRGGLVRGVAVALVVLQAWLLLLEPDTLVWRDPRALVPTATERENADALAGVLASVREPMFAPTKVFSLWRAGLPPVADATALWDVSRGGDEHAHRLQVETLQALAGDRFRALLLNAPNLQAQAPGYPLTLPAFPGDGHAHAVMPVLDQAGLPHAGFEHLWWYLHADDAALQKAITERR